jgi:hypothetical protein
MLKNSFYGLLAGSMVNAKDIDAFVNSKAEVNFFKENHYMEINENKLCPALQRWIREVTQGKRTVIIRLAFSQDHKEAAQALGKIGMIIQSNGPSVIVATSDGESIMQASCLPWVTKIDLPQPLNMKPKLQKA